MVLFRSVCGFLLRGVVSLLLRVNYQVVMRFVWNLSSFIYRKSRSSLIYSTS